MDVWTSHFRSCFSAKYLLLIVDDCTNFMWVFLLDIKDQAYSTFQYFKNMIHRNFRVHIKYMEIDGGEEFHKIGVDLEQEGAIHRFTCSRSYEQMERWSVDIKR